MPSGLLRIILLEAAIFYGLQIWERHLLFTLLLLGDKATPYAICYSLNHTFMGWFQQGYKIILNAHN